MLICDKGNCKWRCAVHLELINEWTNFPKISINQAITSTNVEEYYGALVYEMKYLEVGQRWQNSTVIGSNCLKNIQIKCILYSKNEMEIEVTIGNVEWNISNNSITWRFQYS